MASSKVVRVRPESLARNTSCSVDLTSDSSGDEDNTERDQGLDDFDIIKTIGEFLLVLLFLKEFLIF
jgi:hypothetical protein